MRPTVVENLPGPTLPIPRGWIVVLAAGLCWVILVALMIGGTQLVSMIVPGA